MSSSVLQDRLTSAIFSRFGELQIYVNHRPSWLIDRDGSRLELDIYLPDLSMAVEVQGEQHYRFIPFFHKNNSQYEKQRQRDAEKKNTCYSKGIRLFEVFSENDIPGILDEIKKRNPVQNTPQRSNSDQDRTKERNIKRLISRKRDKTAVNAAIAKLVASYKKYSRSIEDDEILNWYADHKDDIESRVAAMKHGA